MNATVVGAKRKRYTTEEKCEILMWALVVVLIIGVLAITWVWALVGIPASIMIACLITGLVLMILAFIAGAHAGY